MCVSEIPHILSARDQISENWNVVLGGECGLAGLILGCTQYYLRS